MKIGTIIRVGMQALEWGRALRDALRSRDRERVQALLPKELRSVATLEMGKALAHDIALRNRRFAERGTDAPNEEEQFEAQDFPEA